MKKNASISAVAALMALLLTAAVTPAHAQNKMVFKSLEDLDKCAAQYRYDTGMCMEPLEAYAKKNPAENFAIGKRARLQFTHWAALRFFEPALTKPTPQQCADEDLGLAVISGIALPPDRPDFARAKKILMGTCHSALRPAIEKEINASNGAGYTFTNACPLLAEKGGAPAACTPKVEAAAPPPPPEKLPQVNIASAKLGIVKVYAGPEGERVTMADVADTPGAYLVRVDNVRSPINGKTLVHKEEATNIRTTYWTEIDGKRWNTVTVRTGGYKQYEVFVPGVRDSIPVSYSERDTKAASVDALRK